MIQHSQIYRGEVTHQRIGEAPHTFTYPMTFFGFELKELRQIEKEVSLFGYNQNRPLTVNDKDYLRGTSISISHQLREFLPIEEEGQHTMLITSPRYFGSAFNPVNFYLRIEGQRILSAVAEVNNTFGDRHIYPLLSLVRRGDYSWSAKCAKSFHVSPFNDMSGEYRFTFRFENNEIFLGVDLWKENRLTMRTWIKGKAQTITNQRITQYAFLRPFDTALNSMPRILWQAGQLYFRKKLRVFKRPSPISRRTVIDRDHPDGVRPVV